ncbi:MAG: HepT-like ribonuclease domain-containing protein [Candidatus Hodarchaeales archaeon]
MGEAVKNLPSDMITNNPEVNWRGTTAMRDRLIHRYFGVDVSILWETVTTDLSVLNKQIKKIWDKLE